MKELKCYVSFDEQVFFNEEECKQYELNVKKNLFERYRTLSMIQVDEFDFTQGFGDEDCLLDIVDITSYEEVNLIFDIINLYHKYNQQERQFIYDKLVKVLNDETDRLIIYRGMIEDEEDVFDIIMSLNELLDKMRNIGLQTTKNR